MVKDMVEVEKTNGEELHEALMGLTVKELKQVKDAILQLKQGEALERASRPINWNEAMGLGFFGPETNFALNAIKTIEEAINFLCYLKDDYTMTEFALGIAIGSGSRSARRMDGTFDTTGKLGGTSTNFNRDFPTPEHLTQEQPG